MPEYITDVRQIFSVDSDREVSEEDNSNEENSDKENAD